MFCEAQHAQRLLDAGRAAHAPYTPLAYTMSMLACTFVIESNLWPTCLWPCSFWQCHALLCWNLHAMRNCIACSWDAHVSPQAWRLSPPLRHYHTSLPLPQCQEGPEVRPEQVRSSSNAGPTSPKQISTQALPSKPCSALTGSTPHILL